MRSIKFNKMRSIKYIQKCSCGAITLTFDNDVDSSMYQETFDKLNVDVSNAERLPDMCCCNHCVNHWGIDLCECGSGERVGECSCGSNEPVQKYGVKFDSFSAIVENFTKLLYHDGIY